MRYIIRTILFLIILIGTPFIWLVAYGLAGTKEAAETCREVLYHVWYGE